MKLYRPDRVAEQIMRDAAEILQREVKDLKLGFVTFSRVEVSKDLKYAKIFFTALGSPEEQAKSANALNRGRTFIQSRIGQRLNLRHIPEISFHIDKGIDNSLRVDELINKIHEELEERNPKPRDIEEDN